MISKLFFPGFLVGVSVFFEITGGAAEVSVFFEITGAAGVSVIFEVTGAAGSVVVVNFLNFNVFHFVSTVEILFALDTKSNDFLSS